MSNADYLADPFSAILSDLQPDWASYGQCEVGEPWALRFPESDAIRAHFVLDGEIWLTRDNGDVTHLPQGTAALLPFGAAHRLGDDKGSRAVTTDTLGVDVTSGFYRLRIGGPGTARIVCCTLHFNDPVAASLLLALPELITIDTADPEDTTFRRLFSMIDAETQDRRIGAAMLITRLVDIAIMRVLRNWLERADEPTAGLKLAVRDKHIGAALASIHRSPDHPLPLDQLAETAGLSRTVFAERFKAAVGVSPGRYVSEWRITLAHALLQSSNLSIKAIAERLGYESESSFSRAFKRSTGMPPSQVRKAIDASAI